MDVVDAVVAGATWDALDDVTALTREEIGRSGWQPVQACPGVCQKVLWRSAGFVDALIRFEPGSRTPGRPHEGADHHIWVVRGQATIAGQPVVAGSYVHVPMDTEHPIRNVGSGSCVLLQMSRPRPAR